MEGMNLGGKKEIPPMTEEEKAKLINDPENQAAHDEANMLRAQMGQKPDGTVEKYNSNASWRRSAVNHPGLIGVHKDSRVYEDVQPSTKDYENAFNAVENLKKLASEETDKDRFVSRFFGIVSRAVTPFREFLETAFPDPGRTYEEIKEDRDRGMRQFDSATFRLEELKKKGAQLGDSMGVMEAAKDFFDEQNSGINRNK